MTTHKQSTSLSLFEFVVLMALLSSFAAFSIDAILPALPQIGEELKVADPNDVQLIVSMIMLGMGFGQLVYGPLCDSWGRKPTLYAGISVFIVGSLICMNADNLTWMLIGRITQGFGLGSTRVVSAALIRDTYSGRHMSRVMSFIMMVFITIPMIAPLIGQIIIRLSSWKMVFIVIGVTSILTTLWFAIRQPESLLQEHKKPLTFKAVGLAFHEVFTHKVVMAYIVAQGLIFGCFLTYLVTSQAIFEHSFQIIDDFPKYFAIMAAAFGVGAFINSRLVMKFGMRKMLYYTLPIFIVLAGVLMAISYFNQGNPSLVVFLALALPMFFTINVMFTNLNSLAMQLLGHIAGVGAAVLGSLSALIGVIVSVIVGQRYDGTLTLLFCSYLLVGILIVGLSVFAHKVCPDMDD